MSHASYCNAAATRVKILNRSFPRLHILFRAALGLPLLSINDGLTSATEGQR